MHYFIDGYNLLFRLAFPQSKNLREQREAIIYDLNKKISLLKIDATIVFDSPSQIGDSTRSHFDQLEILFTAEGETADEYIIEEIKNSPHPNLQTVITSDKELARRAHIRLAHTETVEEFIEWTNRIYKKKLKERNKEKKNEVVQKIIPKQISEKKTSTEGSLDYYTQVFESQWKEIQAKEQAAKEEAQQQTRPPRRPKVKKDPFEEPQTPEERAASELERWLKIFEKRSS